MKAPGWQARLRDTLAAWQDAPFAWGKHDCCLLAARCVDAMTGSRYVEALGREYRNKRTAAAYIRRSGGLAAAVESHLGPMREGIPGRGDVALVPTEDGPGLGVCTGDLIVVVAKRGAAAYSPAAAAGYWVV